MREDLIELTYCARAAVNFSTFGMALLGDSCEKVPDVKEGLL